MGHINLTYRLSHAIIALTSSINKINFNADKKSSYRVLHPSLIWICYSIVYASVEAYSP